MSDLVTVEVGSRGVPNHEGFLDLQQILSFGVKDCSILMRERLFHPHVGLTVWRLLFFHLDKP